MSENRQFSNTSFYPRPDPNSSRPTLLSNIIRMYASFLVDQNLRERIIGVPVHDSLESIKIRQDLSTIPDNCSSRVVPFFRHDCFSLSTIITEYPSIFNNASFSSLGPRFPLISDSELLITSSSSRQLSVPTRRPLFLSLNANAPRSPATRRSCFSSLFLSRILYPTTTVTISRYSIPECSSISAMCRFTSYSFVPKFLIPSILVHISRSDIAQFQVQYQFLGFHVLVSCSGGYNLANLALQRGG